MSERQHLDFLEYNGIDTIKEGLHDNFEVNKNANCTNCKYFKYYDEYNRSYCHKHEFIHKHVFDDNLNIEECGCLQFKEKQRG
jgi:hypothetical protein